MIYPLIFVLCVIGLWISFYFTGVYYKWFSSSVFWIPKICQLKEANCITILGTPRAKLWGLPNSVYGIALYLYLMATVYVLFADVSAESRLVFSPWAGLVFLALASARSVYLAYSLIFVTKVPCPLCFTTHVINLILFFSVFKMTFLG